MSSVQSEGKMMAINYMLSGLACLISNVQLDVKDNALFCTYCIVGNENLQLKSFLHSITKKLHLLIHAENILNCENLLQKIELLVCTCKLSDRG